MARESIQQLFKNRCTKSRPAVGGTCGVTSITLFDSDSIKVQ